jgi:hypothetical protein
VSPSSNGFDVGPLWKRSPSTRSIAFARKLDVHCGLPYPFATPKISSSLAVVSTIIGERSDPGDGYLIIVSSAHLESAAFLRRRGCGIAEVAMSYAIGWTE